jgi:hypothetical protein
MKELLCVTNKFGWLMVSLSFMSFSLKAQTDGTLDLSHNVIAGGGSASSVSGMSIEGTAGQPVAGTISTGDIYSLRGGFWAFQTLGPTAAHVNLSGRVVTDDHKGIANASVTVQNLSTGLVRSTLTNHFGYYRLEELDIGPYLVRVQHRNYQFNVSEMTVNMLDDLENADFIGTRIIYRKVSSINKTPS